MNYSTYYKYYVVINILLVFIICCNKFRSVKVTYLYVYYYCTHSELTVDVQHI